MFFKQTIFFQVQRLLHGWLFCRMIWKTLKVPMFGMTRQLLTGLTVLCPMSPLIKKIQVLGPDELKNWLWIIQKRIISFWDRIFLNGYLLVCSLVAIAFYFFQILYLNLVLLHNALNLITCLENKQIINW